MATIPHVEASISLPDLLRGAVVLPLIRVQRPHVALVRAADGRANWDFPRKQSTGGSTTLPRIERLELDDASATYDDAQLKKHLAFTLDARMAPGDGPLDRGGRSRRHRHRRAAATGRHRRRAGPSGRLDRRSAKHRSRPSTSPPRARATAPAASWPWPTSPRRSPLPAYDLTLRVARDASAWHLTTLDARLGESRVQGHGQVVDPFQLDGIDLVLDGKVPAPGDLMAAFGQPRRPVPPLDLHARGVRKGAGNELTLDGHLGPDVVTVLATTQGPMARLDDLVVKVRAHGTELGQLLPLLGRAKKTVPSYALDAGVTRQGANAAKGQGTLTLGDARLEFAGAVGDLKAMQAIDVRLAVSGKNPEDLLALADLPKLSLPTYKVAGHFSRDGRLFKVADLKGAFGNSDIKGTASIDLGQKPPRVEADLTSELVDLDDFAGLTGAPAAVGRNTPGTAAQKQAAAAYKAGPRLIPDTPIDTESWRNLDADVRYRGKRVNAPKLPISDLAAHVVMKKGWLTLDPFAATVADGKIVGHASLDGSRTPLRAKVEMSVNQLKLAALIARLKLANDAFGVLDGRVQLTGAGASPHALAAAADGRIAFNMQGGAVDAIMPQLAGLKTVPALVTYLQKSLGIGGGEKSPIRCAVADFGVRGGVMTARTVLLDTPADKMTIEGTVDLGAEQLDLIFHDYPRNPSIGSSRQPISIQGSFKSPSVAPAPAYVKNQTLGWVLAPLAAVVPFVELGKTDEHPCADAVKAVRDAARPR